MGALRRQNYSPEGLHTSLNLSTPLHTSSHLFTPLNSTSQLSPLHISTSLHMIAALKYRDETLKGLRTQCSTLLFEYKTFILKAKLLKLCPQKSFLTMIRTLGSLGGPPHGPPRPPMHHDWGFLNPRSCSRKLP